MAKDPAFLFYPNDWLGGTLGMTFEEKGAYIELLMLQFNRGHMTTHMIGHTVGQIWDKIKDKFVQDQDGLWYNERLEEEKNKRIRYSESRRNNVNGTNQYTKKNQHMGGHMTNHMNAHTTSHMENENENRYLRVDSYNSGRVLRKKGGLGENKKIFGAYFQPKERLIFFQDDSFRQMTDEEFELLQQNRLKPKDVVKDFD